ncbi:hypothetical protein ACJ5NV_07340 [Loktanella agnita]|uniref:hypothetical protein n=1 Tax=Loktanella agnita TaxID=287097 RepID=UPI003988076D
MSGVKTVATVVGTFAVALGIGFVMQSGQGAEPEPDQQAELRDRSVVHSVMVAGNAYGNSVFGVPDVVTTPLNHSGDMRAITAISDIYPQNDTPKMGTILSLPFDDCETSFQARATSAALVALEISSPCDKETSFVVRHDALVFSGVTDSNGYAEMRVPALSDTASFTVSFQNIVEGRVTIAVPDAAQYDRAMVQWLGTDNLQLHALEFGAQIGEPGHVWSGSMDRPAEVLAGTTGFMVQLGVRTAQLPYQAQIYTYPFSTDDQQGAIDLQIGVLATEANCGRVIDAMIIQTHADQIEKEAFEARIPSCDTVGEFVMLEGMFDTITLAARE